jgi:outer membrane immunogenic protein
MRKVLLGGVASLAFGIFAVSAADMPVKAPFPSPLSSVPVYNWTGLYAGVHLGGIGGKFTNNVPTVPGPIDSGGSVMGGVQVGYNWQSNQFVFGIEADTSAIKVKASAGTTSFEEKWLTTMRGRVGYAWDRYLAYVTAGAGFTKVDVNTATGSANKLRTGIAVGAGLEAILWSPNWTGRAEYLYVDVPKETYLIGATRIDGGSNNHIGRVALNYKFW